MSNNPTVLLEFLEAYRPHLGSVAFEETENWRSVVGMLAEEGFKTLVI